MHTINVLDRSPFKHLVCTIGNLPTSFVDSMSYYEALAWLVNYIEKTLIPAVNDDTEAIAELQEKFVELKQYVDDYFSDLNVQEQIDNKLDEMVESGELADIINQEIFGDINDHLDTIDGQITDIEGDIDDIETQINSKINPFDTVADMVNSTILTDGTYARTMGLYAVNDNGSGLYKITARQESDNPNGMDVIAIGDNLIATLITNRQAVNPAQLGAVLDGETDDTAKVYRALQIGNVVFPRGKSVFLDNLNMVPYRILDFNGSTAYCNGRAINMGTDAQTGYFRDAVIKNAFFYNEATSSTQSTYATIKLKSAIRCTLERITQSHVLDGQIGIYIDDCFNIDIDTVFLGNGNGERFSEGIGIKLEATTPTVSGTNNLTNISVRNGLIQNLGRGINVVPTDGSIDTVVFDNIGMSNCHYGYDIRGSHSSSKNIMISNSRVESSDYGIMNYGTLTTNNLIINFIATTGNTGIYNRTDGALVCKGTLGFIARYSNISITNQGFADLSGCYAFGSQSLTPANFSAQPAIRPMVIVADAHSGTNFGNFVHPINDYTILQSDSYSVSDLPTSGVPNGASLVIMYNGEQIKYTYRSQTWYKTK